MPIIQNSAYKAPKWLINGHFDTIFPALFRKIKLFIQPQKHIIETPDDDFFDLDYYENGSENTVIISHGLEGNNQRPYVLGMVNAFTKNDWNVIAWSYRGCNGTINKTIKSYHSGFTEDLIEVIRFAGISNSIKNIALVGFSLGGNMTLRYFAQKNVSAKVKAGVAISAPLDLHQSCLEISRKSNWIYANRFLKSLKQKIHEKSRIFSEIQTEPLSRIRDLKAFDDHYTAPLHGFKDAMDYYRSCSSIFVLDRVKIPTLIINAQNDPFLPASCYPIEALRNHPNIFIEYPEKGGHVGFYSRNNEGIYWSEKRAVEFVNSILDV